MKTKFLPIIIVIGMVVAWGLYVLPQSLSKNIGEEGTILITCHKAPLVNGELEISSSSYEFTPNSEGYKELKALFSQYNYHRYFATLLPTNGMSYKDNRLDYSYEIFINEPTQQRSMLMGGDGSVRINNRLYKMDVWGNKQQIAFMEALKSMLEDLE